MFWIYVLLAIIAVGVLLASEPGQKLLGVLIACIVIGGVLSIALGLLMLGYAIFNAPYDQTKKNIYVLITFIVMVTGIPLIAVLIKIPVIGMGIEKTATVIRRHYIWLSKHARMMFVIAVGFCVACTVGSAIQLLMYGR